MTVHDVKVQPPYFDAILDGTKTFEVRLNDRSYQRGDTLHLIEWHPWRFGDEANCWGCRNSHESAGHQPDGKREISLDITCVYSGDPRFGGIERGYVVLGLTPVAAAGSR